MKVAVWFNQSDVEEFTLIECNIKEMRILKSIPIRSMTPEEQKEYFCSQIQHNEPILVYDKDWVPVYLCSGQIRKFRFIKDNIKLEEINHE